MEKFDRFSIFPVYIDIPLKSIAERYLKEQKSSLSQQNKHPSILLTQQDDPFIIDGYKTPQRLNHSLRRYNSLKLGNVTFLNDNGYESFMSNLPLMNQIDSVELIGEDGETYGTEELESLLSSMMFFLNEE